jgi:hypothetical protein
MRLSDILSGVDLTVYPLIALVIFVGIFVVVLVRVARASRASIRDAAALPLADDAAMPGTRSDSETSHG